MEERGSPVRALDGVGPDLVTPLPAQTPHRPTGGDKVNSQLKAPADPVATAEAPPTAMAHLADADPWSTAEAEATRSAPPESAEPAKQVGDTWSAAEASEVTFERTQLADSTDDAASKPSPAGSPGGGITEARLAERADDGAAVSRLPGSAAESVPADVDATEPHPAQRPGAGVEPHVPDSEGDGEMPAPTKTHRDHVEPHDALPDGVKPQPYKLRRAAACAILFIAVITTLLGFLLVIAAGAEDSAIESHTGRADAEVLDVTAHRTLVRFQTPDGAEHVPNVGVLYPEALEEGQVVRVEYDMRDPDLVRVAGRGATLTFLPAFTTLFAVWTVSVGLVWWLRKPGPLHLRSLRARRKLAV
uniref:DUF3592 domain-containing protein n=1 Tax=Actinokineospora xionganensis TaxID=2684470 RepID=UPI0035E45BAE